MRVNLFTELKYMETVLDERTEADSLRRCVSYFNGSFILLAMAMSLVFSLSVNATSEVGLRQGMPAVVLRPLGGALFAAGLLWLVGWGCCQLAFGLFRLDLSARRKGRIPGGAELAIYILGGGMWLPALVQGFYSGVDVWNGLWSLMAALWPLGSCAVYGAMVLAHNVCLWRQGAAARAALPPARRANAAAALAFCLVLAAGAWATAGNDVLRGTSVIQPLAAVEDAWYRLDEAVYENEQTIDGVTETYTGYDQPAVPGRDAASLLVWPDGAAMKEEYAVSPSSDNSWSVYTWAWDGAAWRRVNSTDRFPGMCVWAAPSTSARDVASWAVEHLPDGGARYTVTYTNRYWRRRPGRETWAGGTAAYTLDADGELTAFSITTPAGDRAGWAVAARGEEARRQKQAALEALGAGGWLYKTQGNG